MYIINFSLRSLRSSFFEERHSHHYYFLKYSPHTFHELSSPRTLRNVLSNSMLEQRDVQVSQSWQGREEKLKLRLSRGIPRRFRPSLRILTTPSPNLEIYLASIQCIVGYAIENTLNTLVVHEPALELGSLPAPFFGFLAIDNS